MHNLSRTALAVTLPLALSVSMAHASEPGSANAGSGETPRGVSTATLPENVSPRQVPVVEDPSILDEIGREIVDTETLRARYGTLTRSADGTVTETPASDEVMRSLMGFESDTDPAFEDEEEARFVSPEDRRRQIMDASRFPVTAVGLLWAVYGENGLTCSASLIGPATLITAAHCVYDHETGWPDDILYVPSMLDADTMPYGVWEYEQVSILPAYVTQYNGVYGEVIPYDLAVVNLQTPIGDDLGWLGFGATEDMPGFVASILSYPGDKPFGTLWESNCNVSFGEGMADDLHFVHFCDTFMGSSGGSLYAYYPLSNQRTVHGINVAEVPGPDGFNLAVRLNQPYFDWIVQRWK